LATLAIVGFGYVGQALADVFSDTGISVIAVDPIKAKSIDGVFSSVDEAMRNRPEGSNVSFIIAVPTPLDEQGSPDLSFVKEAAVSIAPHLKKGDGVALESTTYPGTTSAVVKGILENHGLRAGQDFALCFSSERIDPGRAIPPLQDIPKVVGAFSEKCFTHWFKIYSLAFKVIHRTSGMAEAELSKLIENTYRLVNISLINEIARFAMKGGIDIHDAIRAAATKPYGFQPFYPSIGAGGHCIPVDPGYLIDAAQKVGSPVPLLTAAMDLNRGLFLELFDFAFEKYFSLFGRQPHKILIFGVAYKSGSKDFRESPVLHALDSIREGFPSADIEIVDSGAISSDTSALLHNYPKSAKYDLCLATVVHPGDLAVLRTLEIEIALDFTTSQVIQDSLAGWQSGFHL
jgi:nucleotide sugar dehydrogenase